MCRLPGYLALVCHNHDKSLPLTASASPVSVDHTRETFLQQFESGADKLASPQPTTSLEVLLLTAVGGVKKPAMPSGGEENM